jgi:hypothetical protein
MITLNIVPEGSPCAATVYGVIMKSVADIPFLEESPCLALELIRPVSIVE